MTVFKWLLKVNCSDRHFAMKSFLVHFILFNSVGYLHDGTFRLGKQSQRTNIKQESCWTQIVEETEIVESS